MSVINGNQAYIAVKQDGFVDGACFTESEDSQEWCDEMIGLGMNIQVCDRKEAKRVLFTTIATGNGLLA